MSALRKKIEFYKGKSDCDAIVITAWGMGQSPAGISGGKTPQNFGFLMSLRRLNGLQWH